MQVISILRVPFSMRLSLLPPSPNYPFWQIAVMLIAPNVARIVVSVHLYFLCCIPSYLTGVINF